MGDHVNLGGKAMATRWRRRRMCTLGGDGSAPASIRTISASGVFLETNARPLLGRAVELRHPEAGTIIGFVDALRSDGVALRFASGEEAVAFAMAAIAADMSSPS